MSMYVHESDSNASKSEADCPSTFPRMMEYSIPSSWLAGMMGLFWVVHHPGLCDSISHVAGGLTGFSGMQISKADIKHLLLHDRSK